MNDRTTLTTTGLVKSIKRDGKGLQLNDGSWYSGFKQVPCQRRDEVEIQYTQNNQWKNIVNIRVIKKAAPSSSGSSSPEWSYREAYAKDILVAMITKNPSIDALEAAKLASECEKLLHSALTDKPKPQPSPQSQEEPENEDSYY